MTSPYAGVPVQQWAKMTEKLVNAHPLKRKEIVDVVLVAWDSIFKSKIGRHGFQIGVHLFPKPQIMGFFLHELIPLELSARYPKIWRGEQVAQDKDIVHIPDPAYSIEIKTSSHPTRIFGNRSYAQQTTRGKKAKTGYYLAVNFGKCVAGGGIPQVSRIRFG